HERGAFTGAFSLRRGALELAENGTLFLDEIGEAPAEAQVTLLRAFEERRFRRVGGDREIELRARSSSQRIATSRGSFEQVVSDVTFKNDSACIESSYLRFAHAKTMSFS